MINIKFYHLFIQISQPLSVVLQMFPFSSFMRFFLTKLLQWKVK